MGVQLQRIEDFGDDATDDDDGEDDHGDGEDNSVVVSIWLRSSGNPDSRDWFVWTCGFSHIRCFMMLHDVNHVPITMENHHF